MTDRQLDLLRSTEASRWSKFNSKAFTTTDGIQIPTSMSLFNVRVPACTAFLADALVENKCAKRVEGSLHVYYFGVALYKTLGLAEACGLDFASALHREDLGRVYFTLASKVFPSSCLKEVAPRTLCYHGTVCGYRRPLTGVVLELWSVHRGEASEALFRKYAVQVVPYVPQLFSLDSEGAGGLKERLKILLDSLGGIEDEEFASRLLVASVVQCAAMRNADEAWVDPFVTVDAACEDAVAKIASQLRDRYGLTLDEEAPLPYDYVCHAVRTCSASACAWDTFEGRTWDRCMEYRGGYKFAAVGRYDDGPCVLYDFCSMYPSVLVQFTEIDSTRFRSVSECLLKSAYELLKENPGMKRMLKKMCNSAIGCMGSYKHSIGRMKCLQNRSVLAATCRLSRTLLKCVATMRERLKHLRVVYTDTDSILFSSPQLREIDWNQLLTEINTEWIPNLLPPGADCYLKMRVDKCMPRGVSVLEKGKYLELSK